MEATLERVIHDLARKMDDNLGIHYYARTFHRYEGWLQVEVAGALVQAGVQGLNIEDHETSVLGGERYVNMTFPNAALEIACEVDDVPHPAWFSALRERLAVFDKYLYQYLLVCVIGGRPAAEERSGFRLAHRIDGNGYTLILYRRNR